MLSLSSLQLSRGVMPTDASTGAHLIPMVDVGNERRHHWSMVTYKMIAPVTGTTLRLTVPVPADSRQ